ncbi:MAG: hypothetical protein CM1200mP39_09880 [Dehalococcoidia bacterium]|nr:MAG: hypothetical protein CM1200mP39_09880 [Dehalococcoidia bacterium]
MATPAHLNAEAALHVLSYGIPTLIEKPPGLSSNDARRLLTVAQKKSTNVMVGLDRRFNPLVTESLARVRGNGPIVQIAGEFHKDIRDSPMTPGFSGHFQLHDVGVADTALDFCALGWFERVESQWLCKTNQFQIPGRPRCPHRV